VVQFLHGARDFFSSPVLGRACSTNGGEYRILVGKPEGKRPLVRPRHRWVDNIKTDFREIRWDSMDWTNLVRIETSGGLL
jgi:hypothetical protein